MKDRAPLYPGRVKLTPVSGQENTYDMVRADEPTQEGTPLNKASLLTDATAALFGLGSDAVPDDVLNVISRFQSGMGNEHIWKRSDGAYVNSHNSDAYPPSVDDGYTYEYMGQLGDSLSRTGSYIGTGKYGSSANSNKLTLDFEAKLLIVIDTNSARFGIFIRGSTVAPIIDSNGSTSSPVSPGALLAKVTWNGNIITWYTNGHEYKQLNAAGKVYRYIAI